MKTQEKTHTCNGLFKFTLMRDTVWLYVLSIKYVCIVFIVRPHKYLFGAHCWCHQPVPHSSISSDLPPTDLLDIWVWLIMFLWTNVLSLPCQSVFWIKERKSWWLRLNDSSKHDKPDNLLTLVFSGMWQSWDCWILGWLAKIKYR